MKYTVYLRTNLINGKQYVGQTKKFERREYEWNQLSKRYANKYIADEREKYGLENFKVEILRECETQEEAWNLEQKFILERNTKYPNGYNMGNGGKGPIGTLHTDESRKNISEGHKGQIAWNKGVKMPEEFSKKISESKKGIPNKKLSKKVFQYTLDGKLVNIWESSAEAERNGFSSGTICSCCNGTRKTYKGYIWKH